jgi:hypothetical protein
MITIRDFQKYVDPRSPEENSLLRRNAAMTYYVDDESESGPDLGQGCMDATPDRGRGRVREEGNRFLMYAVRLRAKWRELVLLAAMFIMLDSGWGTETCGKMF